MYYADWTTVGLNSGLISLHLLLFLHGYFYSSIPTVSKIYDLFNDAFTDSDIITSHHATINEKWIWAVVEGSGRGLMCITIAEFDQETEGKHENSSHAGRSTRRVLKLPTAKHVRYEPGVAS